MNWQPIETAPKDGSQILLWHPDYLEFGYWQPPSGRMAFLQGEGHWAIVNNGDYRDGGHGQDYPCGELRIHDYKTPTHWMPLPEPPKETP